MIELATCISCGLQEDVGGIGSIDLDPTGGLLCQGGAGNGTPTSGRGVRIKSTNGSCNQLVIAGDGTVTVPKTNKGWFTASGGTFGSDLTPGSATVNAQMLVDNTQGCAAKNYLFAVEFNLQTDETGTVQGLGGYRINSGSWNDIYVIAAQAPFTTGFNFCPSVQSIPAGQSHLWDVRFTLGGSLSVDNYAIRLAAWGDYA